MWSAEAKTAGPTVGPEHPHETFKRIKQAKVINEIGYRYATRLYNHNMPVLNPSLHVDDLISYWAPPLEPSLHVDDHPGYSIKTDNWVVLLTDHRDKYGSDILEKKQGTGHARVLSCTTRDTTSTITRSIQEQIMFAYVDTSRMFNRDVLPKLFTEVLPKVLSHGAWVFVRLKTPNDSELVLTLIKASKDYAKLHLCKPPHSDKMTQEAYAVFECFGAGTCQATVEGWWGVTQTFMSEWVKHVSSGCDIYNYLHAIGIQTDAQCRAHHEQTHQ
jgi:hypothetical protein